MMKGGGIPKAEGSGVCTNCLERKGSPVGSQHLIIVLEKSGAGRGCEDSKQSAVA